MERDVILEKIIEILKNRFEYLNYSKELNYETHVFKDLDMDDIDMVEFAVELEMAFELEVVDDDVIDFETLGEYVDYICDKLPA